MFVKKEQDLLKLNKTLKIKFFCNLSNKIKILEKRIKDRNIKIEKLIELNRTDEKEIKKINKLLNVD